MLKLRLSLFLAAFGLIAAAVPASALTFTLTEDGCTGTCGTPPFGTVDVVQGADANTVDFTVTLDGTNKFVSTGGPHHAFSFNVDGTISIVSLLDGFAVGDAPGTQTPFGVFDYTIDCPDCGPGASNAMSGPLTFSVIRAGGLDPTAFTGNDDGFYFAADIIGGNGNTGNVAARVPEPTTLMLLGSGLLGITAAGRRRTG